MKYKLKLKTEKLSSASILCRVEAFRIIMNIMIYTYYIPYSVCIILLNHMVNHTAH